MCKNFSPFYEILQSLLEIASGRRNKEKYEIPLRGVEYIREFFP